VRTNIGFDLHFRKKESARLNDCSFDVFHGGLGVGGKDGGVERGRQEAKGDFQAAGPDVRTDDSLNPRCGRNVGYRLLLLYCRLQRPDQTAEALYLEAKVAEVEAESRK
jgi:hypothetical protein